MSPWGHLYNAAISSLYSPLLICSPEFLSSICGKSTDTSENADVDVLWKRYKIDARVLCYGHCFRS